MNEKIFSWASRVTIPPRRAVDLDFGPVCIGRLQHASHRRAPDRVQSLLETTLFHQKVTLCDVAARDLAQVPHDRLDFERELRSDGISTIKDRDVSGGTGGNPGAIGLAAKKHELK